MPTTKETTAAQDAERDITPVEDLTQPLALHSKRTERKRKKLEKRANSKSSCSDVEPRGFLDLPLELLMAILELLRPSDIFVLSRVNARLRTFLLEEEVAIARHIVNWRYPILAQCFLRPVLMEDIDPAIQPLLSIPDRPDLKLSHRIPHQNIPQPDVALHCTCMTCLVRWTSLCAAVDMVHWQDNLDKGEPIPTIPRGQLPAWNQELIASNRRVVLKSLTSPLWYARILEAHLDSTTRSIRRHSQNKGDRRLHFRMTEEDMRAGTDAFLQRAGPPTFDYPYSRELYYMLEAFLPSRSWLSAQQKWVYMSQSQEWHEKDLETLVCFDTANHWLSQNPAIHGPDGNHLGRLPVGDRAAAIGVD